MAAIAPTAATTCEARTVGKPKEDILIYSTSRLVFADSTSINDDWMVCWSSIPFWVKIFLG